MKLRIDIDDALLMEIKKFTGVEDTNRVVDLALRELLRQYQMKDLK